MTAASSHIPDCLGPRPTVTTPSWRPPAGCWDTQFHVLGPQSRFPYPPQRHYTPPDAPLDAWRRMADALGIDRADLYLAANPELRDFLKISDSNEVQLAELPSGLQALADDPVLREKLAITDAEIDAVQGIRMRGRVTTAAQYAALILNMRWIFA